VHSAVEALSASRPSAIVLPEGSRFLSRKHSGGTPILGDTLVVDSWTTNAGSGSVNVGYGGAPDGRIYAAIRAKRMLTPQGEYVIGAFVVAGTFFGHGDLLRTISEGLRIRSETWGDAVAIPGTDARASVLFCSEMLAPGFGKQLVREEGSDALFFLLSHGTFRPSRALRADTLRFLKVQAVEAGVPLFASGDQTPAYALDAYGRVAASFGTNGRTGYGIVALPVAP
jgi:apolipoprotein N-acyltransferase